MIWWILAFIVAAFICALLSLVLRKVMLVTGIKADGNNVVLYGYSLVTLVVTYSFFGSFWNNFSHYSVMAVIAGISMLSLTLISLFRIRLTRTIPMKLLNTYYWLVAVVYMGVFIAVVAVESHILN